jgi:hypothetical protein
MPASTLSGRSVALLRVNLDDCTSEGRVSQLFELSVSFRSIATGSPGWYWLADRACLPNERQRLARNYETGSRNRRPNVRRLFHGNYLILLERPDDRPQSKRDYVCWERFHLGEQ